MLLFSKYPQSLLLWCSLVLVGSERSCSIGCRSFTVSTRPSALTSSADVLNIMTTFTWSSKVWDFCRCFPTGTHPVSFTCMMLTCTWTYLFEHCLCCTFYTRFLCCSVIADMKMVIDVDDDDDSDDLQYSTFRALILLAGCQEEHPVFQN